MYFVLQNTWQSRKWGSAGSQASDPVVISVLTHRCWCGSLALSLPRKFQRDCTSCEVSPQEGGFPGKRSDLPLFPTSKIGWRQVGQVRYSRAGAQCSAATKFCYPHFRSPYLPPWRHTRHVAACCHQHQYIGLRWRGGIGPTPQLTRPYRLSLP